MLRIEDTDQTRFVSNAEKYIAETLDWCNIPFDEGPGRNENYGPYRQSERKELYKKFIDVLIENKSAYYAFDTAEALDFHRKDHEAKGKTFIYNHHNRKKLTNAVSLDAKEVKERIKRGDKYVVRFKMYDPENEDNAVLTANDLVRGNVSFKKDLLDEKILFKSDGMPTYHLANVIDDHLMKISHVIRGEEWLPSLPLHIALYNAFGWEAPEFAHLPLILKPVGKGKLSKRDGDRLGFPVFPLEYTNPANGEISAGYRESGYFPETVVNFLALLGWNPGTEQELFSLEQLIEAFSLEKVNKSGARFDPDKTKWFNQQFLQLKTNKELGVLFQNDLEKRGITTSVENVEHIVGLLKERAVFVSDFWALGHYFFETPENYDAKAAKKQWKEDSGELMRSLIEILRAVDDFQSAAVEAAVKNWITANGYGFGKIMQPFRLSLVGAMKGPHLFDIAAYIGKNETINRLQNAINRLS